MRTIQRFATLALLATFTSGVAASVPAAAQCPPVRGGVSVTVGLMNAVSDPKARREHIFISSSLAAELGIGPYDTTPFLSFTPGADVNPQVRVIIESPVIDGRESSAVFTVAGVFNHSVPRI